MNKADLLKTAEYLEQLRWMVAISASFQKQGSKSYAESKDAVNDIAVMAEKCRKEAQQQDTAPEDEITHVETTKDTRWFSPDKRYIPETLQQKVIVTCRSGITAELWVAIR